MPDINLWATGAAVLIAAIVAAVISLRNNLSVAKKSDLESVRESYVELQATYQTENDRLNAKVDKLRNEKDTLFNKQEADRADCEKRIMELERKLTILMMKLPEPGAVIKAVLVGAEVPIPVAAAATLPVEIVDPIPIPMTVAEKIAAEVKAAVAQATEEVPGSKPLG